MVGDVGEVRVRLEADSSSLKSAFDQAKTSVSGFESSMSAATRGSNILMVAVMAQAAAVVALGVKAVIAAGQEEQLTAQFGFMLKSAEAATAMVKGLEDFDLASPFQLNDVKQAGKSLIAYGVVGTDTTETLKTLGDVAAGVGIPLSNIASTYGLVKTQGALTTRTLMTLTKELVPVTAELAKVMGVSQSEVWGMVKKGQVSFETFGLAMKSMTAAGGQFNGAMATMSALFISQWETAKTHIELISEDIGQKIIKAFDLTGALQGINDFLTQFSALLDAGGLKYALDKMFSPEVKVTIFAITGAIVGGLMPAMISLAAATWAVVAPLIPFLAIGAALGLVGYAIYDASMSSDQLYASSANVGNVTVDNSKKIAELTAHLKELQASLNGTGKAASGILAPFDQINKITKNSGSGSLIDTDATLAEIADVEAQIATLKANAADPFGWRSGGGLDYTVDIGLETAYNDTEKFFLGWDIDTRKVGKWLSTAWHDYDNWMQTAEINIGKWVSTAANDTANWIKNAWNDTGRFLADFRLGWVTGWSDFSAGFQSGLKSWLDPIITAFNALFKTNIPLIGAVTAPISSYASPYAQPRYVASQSAGGPTGLSNIGGGLASYDVGTPYVPYDQLALVHKGEKITPASQNNNDNSAMDMLLTKVGSLINAVSNMGSGGNQTLVYMDSTQIAARTKYRQSIDMIRNNGRA